jgi:hypothetical protein
MQTALQPKVTFLVDLFPTAGQPVWDPACQEYCLTDSDGISYLGSTPGECRKQFLEALQSLAQHLRRSSSGLEDLLAYRTQQPVGGRHE